MGLEGEGTTTRGARTTTGNDLDPAGRTGQIPSRPPPSNISNPLGRLESAVLGRPQAIQYLCRISRGNVDVDCIICRGYRNSAYSSRMAFSSSGVKSSFVLKILRICFGVLPSIRLATLAQQSSVRACRPR